MDEFLKRRNKRFTRMAFFFLKKITLLNYNLHHKNKMNPIRLTVAIIFVLFTLFSVLSCTGASTLTSSMRTTADSGVTGKTTLVTISGNGLSSVSSELEKSNAEKTLTNQPLPDFPFVLTLPTVIHTLRVLNPLVTPSLNGTLTKSTETPAMVSSENNNSVTPRMFPVNSLRSEIKSVTHATFSTTSREPELRTMLLATTTNSPDGILSGLVERMPDLRPELIVPETTKDSIAHNVTMISLNSSENTKRFASDKIYGNRQDTDSAYKFAFPVVIGLCMLTTAVLVYFLIQRLKKANSQMNKASCLLLMAVAFMDLSTMCFALAEICFLFSAIAENKDFIPPEKCGAMLVLERLSAIPHAASTWMTVILAIQRFCCVSKPFSASKYITLRSAYILVISVIVFAISLHMCRFFDKTFMSVQIIVSNSTITSCRGHHKNWIHNPLLYESLFSWTRIFIAQFIPGILIVTFVILMIKSLRDTSMATKRMNMTDSNLQSDRLQLSVFVAIVAIIVFCVEISSGIFMSLNAWELSTGQEIVSYQSLKAASIAFDLLLYVSYFAIFVLYCIMSKDIRRTLVSGWCFKRCRSIRLNCSNDQEPVSKKSTTLTLLPMHDGASSANQSPVFVEKRSKDSQL